MSDPETKKQMLDALSNIYNAIEEDKGTIIEFSYERNVSEFRTAGSSFVNYKSAGPMTANLVVEIF